MSHTCTQTSRRQSHRPLGSSTCGIVACDCMRTAATLGTSESPCVCRAVFGIPSPRWQTALPQILRPVIFLRTRSRILGISSRARWVVQHSLSPVPRYCLLQCLLSFYPAVLWSRPKMCLIPESCHSRLSSFSVARSEEVLRYRLPLTQASPPRHNQLRRAGSRHCR
jgi:hypothetical protein